MNILYKKNLFFVNCFGIQALDYFFVKNVMYLYISFDCIEIKYNYKFFIDVFYNFVKVKQSLYEKIKLILFNFDKFHYKKLNLIGIGFRSWIFCDKRRFNFLILKAGFSFDICFFISSNIELLCLKSTVILLKGLNKQLVNQMALSLCKIKKWSVYKNKGIFYFDKLNVIKSVKSK